MSWSRRVSFHHHSSPKDGWLNDWKRTDVVICNDDFVTKPYIWQPSFQPRATTILTLIPKNFLFERKYLFKASVLVCMLNFQAVYVWSMNIYDVSFSIFQNHPNCFRTAMTSPIRQRHSAHLKTEPTLAKSVEAPLVICFSCWVNSDRMKHAEFIHIKQNP